VLLGAGYDTRALRLRELAGVRVFEIDHPATQSHKRDVLDRIGARSPSTYLAWNFEARPASEPGREAAMTERRAQPTSELPGALAEIGHDPNALSFTIWEGVTMYLTEDAIDASLRAIRAWSAPGSELAMTYFARTRITEPSLATRVISAVVARVGEPWKWGWDPSELPRYLADRGFSIERDLAMSQAARELLPASFAALVSNDDQRISFSRSHESIALATSP
jgi:O-methyltransferase involved in polyketide biosynthesis